MFNRVSEEQKTSAKAESIYAQLDELIYEALFDNWRKDKDPVTRFIQEGDRRNRTIFRAALSAPSVFALMPIDRQEKLKQYDSQQRLGINYIINDINACANELSNYARLTDEERSKLDHLHASFFPKPASYMPVMRFFNGNTEQKERVQLMQEVFKDKLEQIKFLCAEYHTLTNIKTDKLLHSIQ